MSEYIHHIAGRLRMTLPRIRKQPARAQEIQAVISRIAGVASIEANIISGSLLIRYDTNLVDAGTIMASMKELGLLSSHAAARPIRRTDVSRRPASSPVADKVLDMIVEKLIERSAFAVLGALL
jgi:hypothetical protein